MADEKQSILCGMKIIMPRRLFIRLNKFRKDSVPFFVLMFS